MPPGMVMEETNVDRVSGQIEAPELCNDAELLGEAPEGFDYFLEREVTFLTGELWGAKDRRNTQDGKWKSDSMSWARWIGGFSRHPVNKVKEGACIVLGSSIGGARTAKAMQTMHAMGLDIDSGATLNAMLDKLEKLGVFCLVYTTHSHGKTLPPLPRDTVIQKLKISPHDLTDAKVHEYLRLHDKNRYEESFIQRVRITNPRLETKEGEVIAVSSPPLDKYRLIFPLAEPVNIRDLAGTRTEALAVWEDKITGLARDLLGVHFDTSCTDPSRLFFTPRHPKAAGGEWYSAIVQGEPLRFEDVPAVKKSSYARSRAPGDLNAFELAGGAGDVDQVPHSFTPSGASLNDWHFGASGAASRFKMADLIEDHRTILTGGNGKIEIECPFEEAEHGTKGGTACMVLNPDNNNRGVWSITCQHDSCKSKHKLEFVAEMLAQDWFTEDQLGIGSADSVYMLEGPDEEVDEEEEDDSEVIEDAGEHALVIDARAVTVGDREAERKVRRIIRKALKDAESLALKERLRSIVTAKDSRLFDVPTFNRMWKEEDNKRVEEDRETERAERRKSGIESVDLTAPYRDRCDRIYRVMTKATGSPVIFHHNGMLVDVQVNEHGNPRMVELGLPRFSALVESRIDFVHESDTTHAPYNEINNVFNRDRNGYPPLHRVISSPVFGPDMSLITEPGYHAASGLLCRPREGVEIPPVPDVPDDYDVAWAVNDLVDVLADFPFDGLTTRAEVIAAVGGGADVPSFCHALSAGLTPLCRAFIKGPTPGHFARKDKPRTGATKLLSNVSQMAMLDAMARPQSLPTNKEEVQKNLIASADSGLPFNFYDNLPDSGKVDFGELASAMSAWPRYTGRRLGVSDLVEVAMDATWLFTGNRTQLSAELAERMLLINLDPKMERPGDRDGFKYNLEEHIPAHAGRYLHAFLILVQNWKAKGCVMWEGKALGGFEAHGKIIGGILDAVGIMGFLGNRERMQEVGRLDMPEDMLMDALIEATYAPEARVAPGTLFRNWGAEKPPQTTTDDAGNKVPAPFAGYRVVSIRDTLMDRGIALAHSGYSKGDDGAVFYPDSAKSALSGRIGAMAGAVREWTEDREEKEERQGRYVFQKAGQDKHGILYRLERLELVGK